MRARALIGSIALLLVACQVVGGIEERPFVEVSDAATAQDSASAKDVTSVMCSSTACTHEIGAGAAFTCTRQPDGRVRCSGANDRGQLGDKSIEDKKDPVLVEELEAASDVWAGVDHACARLGDERVSCWGSNVSGELGDPAFAAFYRARGAVVPGLERVRELALGDGHTCARTDANVLCWGSNAYGQTGTKPSDKVETPSVVNGIRNGADDDVIGVAAAGRTTCVLKGDGSVMCWGDNDAGQLANGTRTSSAVPATIMGLAPAKNVSMGGERICAVLRDGTVWCWGGASDRDAGPPPAPVKVDGVAGALRVEVGDEHTCALLEDRTLTCWGYDLNGQLGRDRKDGGAPGPVASLADVSSFDLGAAHTCAKAAGIYYCWGLNSKGQLGEGSTTDQYVPTKVLLP